MSRLEALNARSSYELKAGILAVILVGMPLFVTPYLTNDAFVTPKIAFLGLGLGAFLAVLLYEPLSGSRHLPLPRTFWVPAAAVAVPVVLSWLAGPYKEWSLFGEYTRYTGLVPTLMLVAFGIAAVHSFHGEPQRIPLCLLAAGTGVGAYAVAQIVGLDPIAWDQAADIHAGFSTIGQYNVSSGLLAVVFPIAIAFLWASPRSWLYRVSFGVIALAIVIIDSQAPWAAAVGGGAVAAGLSLRRWKGARAAAAATAIAISVGLTALVLLPVALPEYYPSIDANISTRSDFWKAAADMANDHPVLGRGPNSYAVDSVRYRPELNAQIYIYRWTTDAHSVLMNHLGSLGFAGALGFVLLVLWTVRRIVGIAMDPDRRPWQTGVAGAAVAYLIGSIVTIEDFTVRFAFWAVLAALALPKDAVRLPSTAALVARRPSMVATAAAGLVLVTAGWWAARFVWADHHFIHGYRLMAEGRFDQGEAEMRAAIDLRDEYAYREGLAARLGVASFDLSSEGRPLIERMNRESRYLEDFPSVVPMVRQAGYLYRWMQVDPSLQEDAIDLYRRARSLDRFNPYIAIALADTLIRAGEPEEALEELRAFITLPRDYPRFWGAMAWAHAAAGELDQARRYAALALEIDATDIRARTAQQILERRARRR